MSVTYLLDTNTFSYIAKGNSQAARAHLESLSAGESACISSITEAEVRYGLARRPQAHRLHAAVEALLFKFQILPWGSREAAAYGMLRAKLESKGAILSEPVMRWPRSCSRPASEAMAVPQMPMRWMWRLPLEVGCPVDGSMQFLDSP